MNPATEGPNRRRGTLKINRASGLKAHWLRLLLAWMVAGAATAFAQSLPVSHDSAQIIQF
jgi:hypothetical protein